MADEETKPTREGQDGLVGALHDALDVVGLRADAAEPEALSDVDHDRLTDVDEIFVHGTDPLRADTDGDDVPDGLEVHAFSTNPLNPDSDGDGIDDAQEVVDGTTPTSYTLDQSDDDELLLDEADPPTRTVEGPPTGEGDVEDFVRLLASQVGDTFRMGAEANLGDVDPEAFDSSELVQWASHRAGAKLPDGSWNQYKAMSRAGATTGVNDALSTPGALVFRFSTDPFETEGRPSVSHVAVSLGDGRVIEATDAGDGGVQVRAAGDRFTHAAIIPEFADDTIAPEALAEILDHPDAARAPGEISPPDGGPDDTTTEKSRNDLSPEHDDDLDGISNDQEVAGTILAAHNIIDSAIDRDRDGLTNEAERRLGTNPDSRDSDGDNIPDLTEVRLGTDPLVADVVLGVDASDGTVEGDAMEGLAKVEQISAEQRDAGQPSADTPVAPPEPLPGSTVESVEEWPDTLVVDNLSASVVEAEPEDPSTEDVFEVIDQSVDELTDDLDSFGGE